MDGKVARYLQVESQIGVELDSLADIVSFVVVPSMVGFVKYQYIVPTSIYLACGAYRLARFNVVHYIMYFLVYLYIILLL
jgi:CDP-diacylglycerol--serine O-phosphatidyltransferase